MAISKRPVPGPRNPLRGVIDDNALKALRERNEARVSEKRKELGKRYALHPSNAPTRSARRAVLTGFLARLGGF